MTRYLTAPRHVAACDLGPATVIVNYRTGGVHTLIGPSARWWAEVATTGDPSTLNGLDPQAAARLSNRLRQAGVLIDMDTPAPWAAPATGQPWTLSFGTQEAQAGWTDPPRPPHRFLFLAGLALALALVALHCGRRRSRMARLLCLLGWAARRTSGSATIDDATQVLNAVRWVAMLVPSRVACLEGSAAGMLALSFIRQRATWCHGVAGDPIRLHAWVEVNGQPVAEPPSTLRYTPLRTVPERN
ncbi:hypothetical protein Lesp02_02770 [Lentzea sp. NBRC 105346]|uniref:lasso peptide biosynthesis B2 protein n=1 Tax=Lentzea sp. NBRC 105346 TaxID=3032205 RepID=UPI0024A25332|nr:lasso peptide biosynthesis B2 protein [Lentzea sp. NBRC 105346]GLZ28087.1 hypothetical protein Lesp02_02770 [Lentzea sp. NBRC 105346]